MEGKSKPTLVLGARGGVGERIVQQLKAKHENVVAVARGASKEGEVKDGVKWIQGDVKDEARLEQLFKGAGVVIFAASASQGWSLKGDNTPKHVDHEGCRRVAEVAVKAKVPRLIIISSVYVTRPFHPVALMLSTMFGRIMQWKRRGELAAIAATKGSSTAYTIIRPGGLKSKEGKGLDWMQIGQGDSIGGMIMRDDVAAVTVAASKDAKTKNTVFEIVSGKEAAVAERKGDWSKLFQYLKPNEGSYDPSFYSEGAAPGTSKTEL